MRKITQLIVLAAAVWVGACSPAPAAQPGTSTVPAAQQPSAPAPAAPAQQAGKPAVAQPAPAAGGASQVDADVQQAYDQFVKKEMPGVPIELVQAAKREGTLNLYHLVFPAGPKLVEAFPKAFPFIKVQPQQLNGGPLAEKFLAESRAGQYIADVLQFSSLADAKRARSENFIMQYRVSVADELPKDAMIPDYTLPVGNSIQVIAYNPERIKDEDAKILRRWEGLLDARWDGKRYAISEVMAGGTQQAVNYYLYKTFGAKMWERMAKSGYGVFPGVNPQMDSIVSGENDIAVGGSLNGVIPRWEKGAPIHWHYPEPHVAVPYAQFINAKAPHPNVAKLFQEFSISIPGQQIFVPTGISSYRKGPKDTGKYTTEPWHVAPDPAKYWAFGDDELAAAMPDISKQWRGILK